MTPEETRLLSRRVAILGSTGSIGRSTLDVIRRHPGRFEVVGLVAGRQVDLLAAQIREFHPPAVAVADEAARTTLLRQLDPPCPEVRIGEAGASAVIAGTGADVVVAAIVGAAGLVPTIAACSAGTIVALANKEALVVAGELMVRAVRENGATLIPVDSEHSAVHQCLRSGEHGEARRIVLTASGGPFRGRSREQLERVTAAEALRHPTWQMGPKITVDSATLMNKGLEVIEAHWMFAMSPSQIDVLVHPQSIVHSMVEFRDGSVVAQLGIADMRVPIQYALDWPARLDGVTDSLDLAAVGTLSFERPDHDAFPCLPLAYRAITEGGDAPARLNAANEVAVDAFLKGAIGFLDIARVIERELDRSAPAPAFELSDLLESDQRARREARAYIERELTST